MITFKDLNAKVRCIKSHNGFVENKIYKCKEGMAFSAPENWERLVPTKQSLLAAYEFEYRAAKKHDNEIFGKEGFKFSKAVDRINDKYMNMETDLFDSDDLNQIIDKIDNENTEKIRNRKSKS